MIAKILWEIRFFGCVVAVLMGGFWLAFAIALQMPPTLGLALYLVGAGFYGEFGDFVDPELDVWRPREDSRVAVFLQIFLVIVGVLVLNLLIAIMNSVYERVRTSAVAEMLHEKALLILAIERLWLPLWVRARGRDGEDLFPRWLLALAPAAVVEREAGLREALEARRARLRG